ncbi:branched-chain amino acid ABC transporter substrate-binding protein [soil metagenome]
MLKAAVLCLTAFAAVASGPARADIVIGVAGPMTGTFAVLGTGMRDGAAAAVADINRAGGVNGQMLQLETMDDSCNAKTADAIANQLAGKRAVMVVGHLCLAASLAAAPVYFANRIVEISPGTTWPAYTDARPGIGIYRLAGRDDAQGPASGAFLARRFADKVIAFTDDKGPYGKTLADGARTTMNAAGKREAFIAQYDPGQKDFTAFIARLRDAKVDVLFAGGYPAEIGLLARQLRAALPGTVLFGGDTLAAGEFAEIAGDATEGALLTFPPDPRRNAAASQVAAAFRTAGVEPEGLALPAYAAVELWARAARAAKSADRDAVVKAIDTGRYPTVLGDVTVNAKGDAQVPGFAVWQWKGGRIDVLAP